MSGLWARSLGTAERYNPSTKSSEKGSSRRTAGETSDGRRDGGKTKERKTYDYFDDEFEGVKWRECNRTHEVGAQQGGVEKKCQKMGAPTAASAKEQMMNSR